ncbi:MAG TPA: efflux RND transporter periplasmic adaptor subunit [Candidatus Kapabacteria bacterium]|nr:efflux RND transporter periplasmic adaptor subunit [Candidatus Kapabacteria bacterium]
MNQKLDLEPNQATSLTGTEPAFSGAETPRPLWLRFGLPLLVLVVAVLVTWQLMSSSPKAARAHKEREARLVETIAVTQADTLVPVQAWGEVKPARSITLKAQVSGIVKTLEAREPGTFFRQGDTLLQLDTTDYELALAQRRSELEQALANLEIEQGNQAVALSEYELLGTQASAAEKKRMLRGPQLQSANAQVAAARAAVEEARTQLARTTVTAPFEAVLQERHVDVGSHVTISGNLLELVGAEAAWLEVAVPVTQLRWIRFPGAGSMGSTVKIFYDQVWAPQQMRTGRVIRLLSQLEENGRMARVLVQVEDPFARTDANRDQPRLMLGSFVRTEIEGIPVQQAVVIPRALLRENDTVWILKDGNTLEIRAVTVAYRDQENVFIAEGMRAGEQVISSALSTATDGMPVRVKNLPAGERAP